jgi:hypothetical protein
MQSAQRVGPEDKRRVDLPFLSEQRHNVRAQVHAHRRKPLACLPAACWAPQLAPASSLDHGAEPIRHTRLAPDEQHAETRHMHARTLECQQDDNKHSHATAHLTGEGKHQNQL